MQFIRWFSETIEDPLGLVGGKGANLGALYRAGFAVPEGYCVTTQAYEAFLAARGLSQRIARLEATVDALDMPALEVVSEQIRALFVPEDMFGTGEPLESLATELRAAQCELDRISGGAPVAVRSSATAEDLPGFSFAGQQDTYLNVRGDDALLQAVVRCWASLWTARAIGYRARSGMAGGAVSLAVVVQRMVQSETSGVLFTANPLTGKRGQTVIDATLGLGEALVSGQVEPDHYEVDPAGERIVSKRLGAKAISIRGVSAGGVTRQEEQAGAVQALTDAQIFELACAGQRVEAHFGSPQDIEWAYAGGALSLLQSRPITSLYPLPERLATGDPATGSLKVLFSFGSVQGMLDPMTPLGRDMIGMIAASVARILGHPVDYDTQWALFSAGERLFINLTGVLRSSFGRRVAQYALGAVDPVVQAVLIPLLQDPRLAPVEGKMRLSTRLRLLRAGFSAANIVLFNLLFPTAGRERLNRRIEAVIREIDATCAQARTPAELLAAFSNSARDLPVTFFTYLLPAVAAGQAAFQPMVRLAQHIPGGAGLGLEISRGIRHNVTTEMDVALWDTAMAIRADAESARYFLAGDAASLARQYLEGRLPAAAQAAVSRFLARYGMRGLAEIDLGRERWREDPSPLMQTIKSYLEVEEESRSPGAVLARGAQVSVEAERALARAARSTRLGWLKARYIHWVAGRVRELAGLRETPKFTAIRAMGIWRKALLGAGQHLVTVGTLERPDDVFFLHLNELEALANGKAGGWQALVAARREDYAREKRRKQVPRLLLSDGTAYYERGGAQPAGQPAADGAALTGSPVSPGVVEGCARVVLDPRGTRLLPGEILVCPATDPSWTPLFLSAGGLVMEMGGMMTHGSVVAREYGLPAVVGISYATQRIHTGQRIRVDGSQGLVTFLP